MMIPGWVMKCVQETAKFRMHQELHCSALSYRYSIGTLHNYLLFASIKSQAGNIIGQCLLKQVWGRG